MGDGIQRGGGRRRDMEMHIEMVKRGGDFPQKLMSRKGGKPPSTGSLHEGEDCCHLVATGEVHLGINQENTPVLL